METLVGIYFLSTLDHLQQILQQRPSQGWELEWFGEAEVLSPQLTRTPVDVRRWQPGQEGCTVGGAAACPA